MNNYFRARPRAVASACIGALVVLLFDLWLSWQGTPRITLVDGWAILNRIMQFENGDLPVDKFLFMPHGAHLHLAAVVPAWLDFKFFGGDQKLTQVISLGATAVFCAFFVWILIREGVRTHTPALLLILSCAAAAALISGLSDREMAYHPFQVVLSLARMSYAILLLAIIKGLVQQRLGLYFAAMLVSMLAVTFHGIGYIFAICVILAHLLVSRRIWMLAFSVLPLLTTILVQAHYSPPGGELSHLGTLFNLRTVREAVPGVSAYFVSPIWTLQEVIGVKALLVLGFVIFCSIAVLTISAVLSILNLRWAAPVQMWRMLVAPRTGTAVDPVKAFLAVMGILLIASAFAATLFWLVRTTGPGDQLPIYHYVLYSGRYGAFACLAFVILIVAMFHARSRAQNQHVAPYAGPATACFSALMLVASLYASLISARTFDEDSTLNVAAAGIALGLSPIQPEVEAVWVGAKDDWYWVDQLPLTARYMRSIHKGIWHDLPPVGAQGASYAAYAIVGLKRTPVASDVAPGRCAISGTLPAGSTEFGSRSLLLPVATGNGIVVGYAALLRTRTPDAPRVISGFAECPADVKDAMPLYLAHDIKPATDLTPRTMAELTRGNGSRPIVPLSDVSGSLVCERLPSSTTQSRDAVLLTLHNDSNFDWSLDNGKLPLRIGVHLLGSDGTVLQFDNGLRVPASGVFAPSKGKASIRFSLDKIATADVASDQHASTAQFELVQDGHSWFPKMHCNVPLNH